ncbi:peroxiredoxin family protein [Haloferacaceae archaeon DSL9]
MGTPAHEFRLANGGAGPDPLSFDALDAAFALLLFHRDVDCGNCRRQATIFADRYDELRARDAEVVSILPHPAAHVREWADAQALPFPAVADPETTVSEAYDQPIRFGRFGRLHNLIGRMPLAVLVDLRGSPTVEYVHPGSTPLDRPGVETVLAELDALGRS